MTSICSAQSIEIAPPKLELHGVKAESVKFAGRQSTRVSDSDPNNNATERLALIPGTDFEDGVIEVELTGDTLPGMGPTFRGFTGIAFRSAADASSYEAFYLRPKNGRSEDQEQRNHSVQYISTPEFPWQRLRKETPGKYESYADLVPGEWTRLKIEVKGDKARLYLQGAAQPVLVVNDLKHGRSKGLIGLWIGPGTVAHFAALRMTR